MPPTEKILPTDHLPKHFRINPPQKKALTKLGLETVEDLLYHFPARYGTTAEVKNIVGLGSLKAGEETAIYGQISNLKTRKGWFSKVPMAEATVSDATGSIKIIWFNQPYLAKMIHEGALVKVQGKISRKRKSGAARGGAARDDDAVATTNDTARGDDNNSSESGGELYMNNPEIEEVGALPTTAENSLFGQAAASFGYPVYPETRGVSSKWFYHAIQKIFKSGILEKMIDPIPLSLLERYNLPKLSTALIWMHAPQTADASISARKRFAFEEIFFIQLKKQKERLAYEKKPAFKIFKTGAEMESFTKRFPFAQTGAQKRVIEDILTDLGRGHAMSRLLEGDVGSGKTAVAAATVYAVTTSRPPGQNFGALQTAYMAPTEILATQHFESFMQMFAYLGISIGLITGSGCKKFPSKINPREATDISRTQLLKWVANGEIPILIGTHALIQKSVAFKNLAYIIIDEQHRFGTAQRQKLRRKDDIAPHLLSMTATPIPRTLALTIYGDLDLSLLDEMPAGRKQVQTEIISPGGREKVYEKIRAEIAAGRQAYVICPRINEPDPTKEAAVLAKSVTEEAARLKQKVFQKPPGKTGEKEIVIDILHSRMKPDEKDAVMEKFKNGETHILVATSVVEVGVNVPNATVIIIEGAERFGLSQLHQLRGRVLRSSHQAYCFVFAESKSEKTVDRLHALTTAKNGFELAEFDLTQRGSGELYGRRQWGISDVAMEGIKNIKMVEAARKEAALLLQTDPQLKKYPLVKERVEAKEAEIHFE